MTVDDRADLIRLLKAFRDEVSIGEVTREASSVVDCAMALIEFVEGICDADQA